MLSIAHSATGAIIAAKVQNPFLYVPIVLALHYLQDFIPHWDVGTGLTNGSRKRIHAFFLEWIDLVLSAGLRFFLSSSIHRRIHRSCSRLSRISNKFPALGHSTH